MLKILRFLKSYKISLILIVAFVFIESITELMLPNYMSDIVQNGILKIEVPQEAAAKVEAMGGLEGIAANAEKFTMEDLTQIGVKIGDIPYIWKIGFLMLLVAMLGAACTVALSYLSSRTSMGMGKNIRTAIFKKGINFSLNEFDTIGTASMITRTTNDVQQIQMLTLMVFRMVVKAPILGIGGVIMAVSKNAGLSLIFLAILPIIALIIFIISKKGIPLFKIIQKKLDKLNLVMRERLTGIRVIRAYDREESESIRFDVANRDLTDTAIQVNRIMAAIMPALMIIMNFTALAIMWFAAGKINVGAMNIGDMMAFIQYAMLILMSLITLSMIFVLLPRASASAERINQVLETEPSIKNKEGLLPKTTVSDTDDLKGKIEYHDVTFSYPGAESPVLFHISFCANPGETTAIIGSTGSGKSTLINLIPRFYDIEQGEITIDGINITDMSQEELRDKIGYIPQKSILFTGSIADNLRYGNPNATLDELKRAAKISMAYDFIMEKPEGFDGFITQGGTNISGGQKQRLSIARAVAKDPLIYVFDDSFSALDFRTDKALRNALKKEIKNATVLIVAQRISSVADADKIIVLNEGKVAGIGKHKELLESNKIYQEIVYSQLPADEIDDRK